MHHLVKISHERGDKYKFEAFPGLAEGLIEKVLEVSSLYYDVKWEISFDELESKRDIYVLDGMNGTPDILKRIQGLQRLDTLDDLETEGFGQKLTKINEAGLVIRNMSLLDDNADYLSRQPSLRDFLSIVLNLPHSYAVIELQHYALDIAEQLTKFWSLDVDDPLYVSLLKQLDGLDRGAILTALRAISRISMNLDESNRLKGVPISAIQRVCEWTLLDDEELVHACLDFLYQFTAVPDNVEYLLTNMPLEPLINQLVRLLLFNARETDTKRLIKPAVPAVPATEIPNLPLDLLEQVLKSDEPERSSHWLRACFEEDADSDITQIALWQAYQARFSEFSTPQNALLPAAEFIKNVSTTFSGANAQVISGPNPKFIIKGIRPRHLPMDPKGRIYTRCLWQPPGAPKPCGEFLLTPPQTWDHVVKSHLRIPQRDDGRYYPATGPTLSPHPYHCHWAGCRHFAPTAGSASPYEVALHLKTHLPDCSAKAALRQKHNRSLARSARSSARTAGADAPADANEEVDADDDDEADTGGQEPRYLHQTWLATAVDERGDAAGLPLTSVLVLRNLARNVAKVGAGVGVRGVEGAKGGGGEGWEEGRREGGAEGRSDGWMDRLFGGVRAQLWFVLANNRMLAGYVADLMGVVEGAGAV